MKNYWNRSASIIKLFASSLICVLVAMPLWSQRPTKEYIYLGGRLVAVENSPLVTPNLGSSGRQTFTYTVWHPESADYVLYAQFLFNRSGLVAQNSCYVSYDPAGNVFYLLNDNATEWFGLKGGLSGTVGNSQCTVHGANSRSSKAGTDLRVLLDVSFRSLFAGTKRMYLLSSDKTGRISDWQEVGAWSDTGDPKAVELISLTPNSGSGGAVTLTSVVKDGDGANTIQFTQFVMNAGLNGYNACFIHYDRASNTFYLLKDDASAWLGLEPGKQVQNSQCVLRAEGSGGTASGNTLTVTYNLLFKGGFTGSRQIYLWTAGNDADIQSWKQMGTWNVSGATLSSAGGSSPTRATRKVAEETGALPGIPSSLSMPTHYRVIRDGMLYRVGETVVETSLPGNADQRR